MAKSNNTLCLDKFYPERDLMITDIAQQSDKIIIIHNASCGPDI